MTTKPNARIYRRTRLFCGRLISRITRLTRPSVRPSVCPSVRPSVPHGLVTGKQRNAEKSKLAQTFPRAPVSGVPIFSQRSKVKVHRTETSKIWRHLYLRAAAPADQAWQEPTAHYAYAIVRPTLLSAPETLGNWTDGRIQCRRGHLSFYLWRRPQ